ncbi:MAG: sugar kinase [Ignavibacteriae bacterium HGW-Ignavibacteriae-2]|nr:sugar kinase [Bacteroidota bacterium]PKL89730.1 MAG: sugar kinase [Ignavibacteriae bacterium HGW-Ignavibacteriae-2]
MSLLVVGSVGYDDVETPFDKIEKALGGSATYISLAASYFSAPINMVGVVGEDFKDTDIKMLEAHNINLDGLEIVKGGKTFRYGCKYQYDLNVRDTLFTHLNVFENFDPVIPDKWKNNSFLLLGNILPSLQLKVIEQMKGLRLMVCDTMNLWINTMLDDLLVVLSKVDMLIINDSEARLLANEPNLIKAAKIIREFGPKYLIIKKGEHGALLFGEDSIFSAPAYPLESIFDPTGAGDAFAGGFAGYLHKTQDLSFDNIKKAVIYGSAMASFSVGKFSTKGLENLSNLEIHDRYIEFRELSSF